MHKLIIAAVPIALLAVPALAEPTCQAKGQPMPMWQVAKGFEDAGGTIRQMKTTNGCYEIYGFQQEKRVEAFFDPSTGVEIERE